MACNSRGRLVKFVKDALHGDKQLMVVSIYGWWVLSSVSGSDFLDSGEQRLDGFVSERHQGGDGAPTGRDRRVAQMRYSICLPRSFFRS